MFRGRLSFSRFLVLPVALCITAGARAQLTHLEALSIDGAQECTVVTPATGTGDVVVDVFAHMVHYRVNHTGLASGEILKHIHGPAGPCAVAPVMINLPLGMSICGSAGSTPAQEANILGSLSYFNAHSNAFGGGEIRGQITPSPSIGQPFCLGDGSAVPCPCGNTGAAGKGCENSATTGGALLQATGHNSPDNVVLICSGELPSALSIFLQGTAPVAHTIFGDGLRCTGGNLKRLAVRNAVNGWVAYPIACDQSITTRSAALGDPIPAGGTRFYQTYYRDANVGFCPDPPGSTFNVSSGVQITW